MKQVIDAAPRAHVVMLGLALATVGAWLLAPDESYKTVVGLGTFLLLLAASWRTATYALTWKPNKLVIALAAMVSLGSCTGQVLLAHKDMDKASADMAQLNCLEARRIERSGHGFARAWTRDEHGIWEGRLPSPIAFNNLFLFQRPVPDEWELHVAGPDVPYVMVECRPDPSQPGYVHPVGG